MQRDMQRDMQSCLNEPDIGGIVIDLGTYGGGAQGCERMSRFIKYADSQKPVYGVVDLNCFSAGYYLAAGCRKIILTDPDAGVGSIGCIRIHKDQSVKNEKDGLAYTVMYFGEEKNKTNTNGGPKMDTRERMAVLLAGEDGPAAIAELGYVKKEDLQAAVAAAMKAGEEKLAATHNVAELCQLGELTLAQSVPLLKETMTVT